MKVAFLYCGMYRGFHDNVVNHIENLIGLYDSDVFINLWDIEGWGGVAFRLDGNSDSLVFNELPYNIDRSHDILKYRNDEIPKDKLDNILNLLKPKKINIESFKDFELLEKDFFEQKPQHYGQPYVKNIYSLHSSINKGFSLIDDYQNYDLIVKLRTDMFFLKKIELNPGLENCIYYNSLGSWDGAINDSMVYGKPNSVLEYCNIFNYLKQLWNEIPSYTAPEIIASLHLNRRGITQEGVVMDFKIKRLNNVLD